MSNTSNRWKKIGGINRTSEHNIVRTQTAVNNSLNITRAIGTSNLDTNVYGNLNIHGNLDVSGTITYDTLDVSGQIICDTLDVSGQITCDTLDVSGQITCGSLNVSGTITTNYTILPTFPTNATGYSYTTNGFTPLTVTTVDTLVDTIIFPKVGVYLLFIEELVITNTLIINVREWYIKTATGGQSLGTPWPSVEYITSTYSNSGNYTTIINATSDTFNEPFYFSVDISAIAPYSSNITGLTWQYSYIKIS